MLRVGDVLECHHDLVLGLKVLGQRVLPNFQQLLALELAACHPSFEASVLLVIDDLFHENSQAHFLILELVHKGAPVLADLP